MDRKVERTGEVKGVRKLPGSTISYSLENGREMIFPGEDAMVTSVIRCITLERVFRQEGYIPPDRKILKRFGPGVAQIAMRSGTPCCGDWLSRAELGRS